MTRTSLLLPPLLLLLAACGTEAVGGTDVTGASAALADAEAVLAVAEGRRVSPTALEANAAGAIAALRAVLASSSSTSGAALKAAAIEAVEKAITAIAADAPNAAIGTAEQTSLASLAALGAGRGTAAAAESGVATLLLDALATEPSVETPAKEAAE